MHERLIPLEDIKFLLIFTYFAYLYCKKKRRTFGAIALCGYASVFAGILMRPQEGLSLIVFVIFMVTAFALSYKELESLGKEGVDAKGFLDPDAWDIAVLVLFLIIWKLARTYY